MVMETRHPRVAFISDASGAPIDHDMDLLLAAASEVGITARVEFWDSVSVDWKQYCAVLFRSPWSYTARPHTFARWCESLAGVVPMFNSVEVARWALNKHYLRDLAEGGIRIVESNFVCTGSSFSVDEATLFASVASAYPSVVVKPSVGAYSKNVRRFPASEKDAIRQHVDSIRARGACAIVQPYYSDVDRHGEVNLVYINGSYSHAIKKEALLSPDGSTLTPTLDKRSTHSASAEETQFGTKVLDFAQEFTGADRPLLYGRVDLIRDAAGRLALLEMDICEPSLNLAVRPESAVTLMRELAIRLSEVCQSRHNS